MSCNPTLGTTEPQSHASSESTFFAPRPNARLSGMKNTPIVLRDANRNDLPGLWEVRYSVAENTLTPGHISDDELCRAIEEDGKGWVVEESGRILGFAIGLCSGNVWALFVRPDAEGRGIGSSLHSEMLTWFSRQRPTRLWLSTGTTTRARRFYEARGWHVAGPYGTDEVRLERPNAGAQN
jgi:GNAT superfamily N-acetyltransferase